MEKRERIFPLIVLAAFVIGLALLSPLLKNSRTSYHPINQPIIPSEFNRETNPDAGVLEFDSCRAINKLISELIEARFSSKESSAMPKQKVLERINDAISLSANRDWVALLTDLQSQIADSNPKVNFNLVRQFEKQYCENESADLNPNSNQTEVFARLVADSGVSWIVDPSVPLKKPAGFIADYLSTECGVYEFNEYLDAKLALDTIQQGFPNHSIWSGSDPITGHGLILISESENSKCAQGALRALRWEDQ